LSGRGDVTDSAFTPRLGAGLLCRQTSRPERPPGFCAARRHCTSPGREHPGDQRL